MGESPIASIAVCHEIIFDEGDSVCLIVSFIDFYSPDADCILNGGVLVTLDRFAIFVFECQELHIDLYLVAWNLFLIFNGLNLAQPCLPRKPV